MVLSGTCYRIGLEDEKLEYCRLELKPWCYFVCPRMSKILTLRNYSKSMEGMDKFHLLYFFPQEHPFLLLVFAHKNWTGGGGKGNNPETFDRTIVVDDKW
jgi:hypothetical protein